MIVVLLGHNPSTHSMFGCRVDGWAAASAAGQLAPGSPSAEWCKKHGPIRPLFVILVIE